jgi:hypothetical protein
VIPITQSRVGENGNCLAAALASVLEIPIEDLPEFTDDGWQGELNSWLAPRSLCYLEFPVHDQERWRSYYLRHAGFHLLCGPSERGLYHAVVARAGKIVHDPHPSRAGLQKVEQAGFLVPTFSGAAARGEEP